MKDYLSKMLNALTSAYSRKDYDNLRCGLSPETNIGKLFAVFAWGLNMVQEQAEKIKAWDNYTDEFRFPICKDTGDLILLIIQLDKGVRDNCLIFEGKGVWIVEIS